MLIILKCKRCHFSVVQLQKVLRDLGKKARFEDILRGPKGGYGRIDF